MSNTALITLLRNTAASLRLALGFVDSEARTRTFSPLAELLVRAADELAGTGHAAQDAALQRLAIAMGNPAVRWEPPATIESALIDEAVRRLSRPQTDDEHGYESVGYQYLFPSLYGRTWRDSPEQYNGRNPIGSREIFAKREPIEGNVLEQHRHIGDEPSAEVSSGEVETPKACGKEADSGYPCTLDAGHDGECKVDFF